MERQYKTLEDKQTRHKKDNENNKQNRYEEIKMKRKRERDK
jgi:hypothetical protein